MNHYSVEEKLLEKKNKTKKNPSDKEALHSSQKIKIQKTKK